jgi:hypothetical protein
MSNGRLAAEEARRRMRMLARIERRLTPDEIIGRFDRDMGRATPRELEEEAFVAEAMRRYHAAEYEREQRRRLWKGAAWGLFLVAIAALVIAWVLTDGLQFLKFL